MYEFLSIIILSIFEFLNIRSLLSFTPLQHTLYETNNHELFLIIPLFTFAINYYLFNEKEKIIASKLVRLKPIHWKIAKWFVLLYILLTVISFYYFMFVLNK